MRVRPLPRVFVLWRFVLTMVSEQQNGRSWKLTKRRLIATRIATLPRGNFIQIASWYREGLEDFTRIETPADLLCYVGCLGRGRVPDRLIYLLQLGQVGLGSIKSTLERDISSGARLNFIVASAVLKETWSTRWPHSVALKVV